MRRLPWLLALLAAIGLAFAPPGPSVSRAQPTPPAGPGLGNEPGRPLGDPVGLRLPPGYALRALRGGSSEEFSDTCRGFLDDAADIPQPPSPACRMAFGEYAVTLELEFDPRRYVPGEDDNRAACIDAGSGGETWRGWVLEPADGATQNLLLPVFTCASAEGAQTPLLTLPPPPAEALASSSPVPLLVTLSGYCLNHSRHAPGEEDVIGAGVLTADPGLLRVVAVLRDKQLWRGASRGVIQDVLWAHTDGEGLTDGDLAALQALP